jgi:hypothetical protein
VSPEVVDRRSSTGRTVKGVRPHAGIVGSAVVALSCVGCLAASGNHEKKGSALQSVDPRLARSARPFALTAAVPPVVVAACRRLASRSRAQGSSRPLYCPPLVPKASSYRIDAAGGLSHGYQNLVQEVGVSVRSTTARRRSFGDHWTFAEGDPRTIVGAYLAPEVGRSVMRTLLGGRPVTVYRMPEGGSFYSGHIVIEWRQRGLAFQVSIHGHRNLKRVRLMSLALMYEVTNCPSEKRPSERDRCRLVF